MDISGGTRSEPSAGRTRLTMKEGEKVSVGILKMGYAEEKKTLLVVDKGEAWSYVG